MSAPTGGPAFPTRYEGELPGTIGGMSLRDYFAAAAIGSCIQQIFGGLSAGEISFDDKKNVGPAIAAMAYECADYMLAERSK